MARKTNYSFQKSEREKTRLKKRKEKEQKKQLRRENSPGGGLDNMIAYVDKFGNITSEPPAEDAAIKPGETETAPGR